MKNSNNPEMKKLIAKIRKSPKYLDWKLKVIKRDFPEYPNIKKKNLQVHHLINISTLIKTYQISTLEEALGCKKLWKKSLGITLTRGEHFYLTRLGLFKYPTIGFIRLLEGELARLKRNVN